MENVSKQALSKTELQREQMCKLGVRSLEWFFCSTAIARLALRMPLAVLLASRPCFQ